MRKLALVAAAACFAALALACGTESYEEDRLALLPAWAGGDEVQYYDLGSNTPAVDGETVATAPVWVLVYGVSEDGSPDMVPEQRSIFDVHVGEPGYSDLWQMTLVTVPQDYEANSIRSYSDIEASGYPVRATELLVNCPFVERDTALEDGTELSKGWVDGEDVYYVDFGPTSAEIGEAWVLRQGEDGAVIFDDDEATSFRKVSLVDVPEGDNLGTLRSSDDIEDAGYVVETTATVLNQPVVQTSAPPPASEPDDGDGRDRLFIVVFAIIALGAVASAGALAIARAKSRW